MGGKSENKSAYFDVRNSPSFASFVADLQVEVEGVTGNLQVDLRRHSGQCKASSLVNETNH